MLRVLRDGRNVGHVWTEAGALRFRYSREWRAAPDAIPLSPLVPLDGEAQGGDAVQAFFGRLLAEGEYSHLPLPSEDAGADLHARLEQAVHQDLPGAFSLRAGQHADAAGEHTDYSSAWMRAQLAAFAVAANGCVGSAFGTDAAGVRMRVDVRFMRGDVHGRRDAASTHTLKSHILPERAFPQVLENEALCHGMAALASLPVVEARLLRVPEPLLLLERHDREVEGEAVHRRHRLDFCQLAGCPPGQTLQRDGGPSLVTVFALIDRYAGVPARERLRALDWLTFNFLIGNGRAHAGNLAMLADAAGRFALAPADALACTASAEGAQASLPMEIGGEYEPDRIGAAHWEGLAEAIGANPSLLRRRAQGLAQRLPDALGRSADALGLARDAPVVAGIRAVISRRAERLAA